MFSGKLQCSFLSLQVFISVDPVTSVQHKSDLKERFLTFFSSVSKSGSIVKTESYEQHRTKL